MVLLSTEILFRFKSSLIMLFDYIQEAGPHQQLIFLWIFLQIQLRHGCWKFIGQSQKNILNKMHHQSNSIKIASGHRELLKWESTKTYTYYQLRTGLEKFTYCFPHSQYKAFPEEWMPLHSSEPIWWYKMKRKSLNLWPQQKAASICAALLKRMSACSKAENAGSL